MPPRCLSLRTCWRSPTSPPGRHAVLRPPRSRRVPGERPRTPRPARGHCPPLRRRADLGRGQRSPPERSRRTRCREHRDGVADAIAVPGNRRSGRGDDAPLPAAPPRGGEEPPPPAEKGPPRAPGRPPDPVGLTDPVEEVLADAPATG